jgi:hypothetical protein
MERDSFLLEEYRTLRQESLQAIQQQTAILQFGLAGLSLLLGLAAQVKPLDAAAALLFVATPLLTWLILVIWQGEVGRMRRAGRFVASLEAVFNRELGDHGHPLNWEQTLQRDQPPYRRLKGRYIAVFVLLMSVALVSIGVGIARVVDVHRSGELGYWIPTSVVLLTGASAWYGYALRVERLNRKKWKEQSP